MAAHDDVNIINASGEPAILRQTEMGHGHDDIDALRLQFLRRLRERLLSLCEERMLTGL